MISALCVVSFHFISFWAAIAKQKHSLMVCEEKRRKQHLSQQRTHTHVCRRDHRDSKESTAWHHAIKWMLKWKERHNWSMFEVVCFALWLIGIAAAYVSRFNYSKFEGFNCSAHCLKRTTWTEFSISSDTCHMRSLSGCQSRRKLTSLVNYFGNKLTHRRWPLSGSTKMFFFFLRVP